MGDKGNIVVRQESNTNRGDVWFYTHWSGGDIKKTAQKALEKGRGRWGDSSYLARIVFQQLIGEDDGETGFGVSTSIADNEHDILVIDDTSSTVYMVPESSLDSGRLQVDLVKVSSKSWSYEQFIKAKL